MPSKKKGSQKLWVHAGRQPKRKMYQEYCFRKHKQGLASDGQGGWKPAGNLNSGKIAEVYQKNF